VRHHKIDPPYVPDQTRFLRRSQNAR
jgi:hypothetical protein